MTVETDHMIFNFDMEKIDTKESGWFDSTYGGVFRPNNQQLDMALKEVSKFCDAGGWEVKAITPMQGFIFWGNSKVETREPVTTGITVLLQRSLS